MREGLRAHVADDLAYGGVRVVLEQRGDSGRVVWGPGSSQRYLVQDATLPPADAVEPLMLHDDEARSILAALQRYYGEDAGDTRTLRRDYEAERARVDKLTDRMLDAVGFWASKEPPS